MRFTPAIAMPFVLACMHFNANAQSAPNSACSFVVFPNEWRDATAADYDSDDWKAFKKFTGVQTPWRIEGDFNGDGVKDVARIVIREADQTWMLGVDFGAKPGTECRSFQISQGLPHQLQSIPSLQTLPQATEKLTCHQAAQLYGVECTVPSQSPIKGLKKDFIIVSDAVAARPLSAYYWTQLDGTIKQDGTPLMAFRNTPLDVAIEMK